MSFGAVINGTAGGAVDLARGRLLIGGALFATAFIAISLRVVDLAVIHHDVDGPQAASRHVVRPAAMARADITDRNGTLLATTLDVTSLGANPKEVRDPAATARALATILPELDPAALEATLRSEAAFVWLRRGLTPQQHYAVNRLGNPGLVFLTEQRRLYPTGELSAHAVGFTNIDNLGLAGVERSMDGALRDGDEALRLSLDIRVQQILREELLAQMSEFDAAAAAGVVLDANTGEILALVSLPDFDPNQAGRASDAELFNRASFGVYELGSVFKIFTLATALDVGAAGVTSRYDAREPIHVAHYTIHDYEGEHRILTLPEVLLYSSNIGAAKIALDIGGETQQTYLRALGLLDTSPVELSEQGTPIYPARWRDINTMTIGFGHGIAVTPIHLASAVAAVVNGGVYHPPTLLAGSEPAQGSGRRVFSDSTSHVMRDLLRMVVADGTGRNAAVPGYRVGGKTSTAEKQSAGGYDRAALISSFVAAFPITDPEYVVMVMLDEPKGTPETLGRATGGWTAAPAVARVISRMAPLLGLLPAGPNPLSAASAAAAPVRADDAAGVLNRFAAR